MPMIMRVIHPTDGSNHKPLYVVTGTNNALDKKSRLWAQEEAERYSTQHNCECAVYLIDAQCDGLTLECVVDTRVAVLSNN